MGCSVSLNLNQAVLGAHLSFYWTMNEASGDRIDSAAGVHWPLKAGTLVEPALFSYGIEINANIRGLETINNPSIVITQANSNGISFWYWVKVVARGSTINNGVFCDLNDFNTGNNELSLFLYSLDGATTVLDFFHSNGVNAPEIVSPHLSWTLGSWHMVAGVYDKVNQTLTIYADGVSVGSVADTFTYPDLVNSDWALTTSNPIGTPPDMIFDELGLCLNGALTQTQITALYNGGAGVTWPNITPIVPYP